MDQIIEAEYIKNNRYKIKFSVPNRNVYALYWSYTADKNINKEHYIATITNEENEFQFCSKQLKRIYFQLVTQEEIIVCAERVLPVKGMINFRDLGGYITEEHKRIKWGILYRSDCFSKLDDESIDYVKALNIKTIIDLRRTEEIKATPNKNIGAVNQINCNPNAKIAALAGNLQNGENEQENDKDIQKKLGSMEKQQIDFVESETCKKAFSIALQLMLNPDYLPLDQHCRGGKDRTGFGVMLLLGVLGVDEKTILEDYMITKRLRKERNEKLYKEFLNKYKDVELVNYYYSLVDTKEEFLLASLNAIHKRYGSIKEYAMSELGITQQMIDVAKAYYLE